MIPYKQDILQFTSYHIGLKLVFFSLLEISVVGVPLGPVEHLKPEVL